jgi:dihydrofolate synthase/folylpolyglutamate synthase
MRTFEEAFSFLKGLTNYETMARPPYSRRAMNLPRTRALLRRLGNPERAYPSLQVAGTKGKGTTATALAAMLGEAGLRAGLYTSPHLFHARERIRVAGAWIPEEGFAAGVAAMRPFVEPLKGTEACPTFFELMTVLGLWHFREARVDVAVLEVGMGGRLDATSVVRPLASVVVHVGLDHTEVLGKTKALIAAEKAAVAKRGVTLVSGVPPASVEGRVVAAVAAERGARLYSVGREFRVVAGRPRLVDGRPETPVSVRFADGRRFAARPAVLSRDLARDTGIAVATLLSPAVRRRLPVDEEAMVGALARLFMPGRVQVLPGRPLLVVDGAHNPDSARSLARAIREAIPARNLVVVAGGGADKDVPGTVRAVEAAGRPMTVIFTRPASHPRAADPAVLATGRPGALHAPSLAEALSLARSLAGPDDAIVVTGSLYLAGEALWQPVGVKGRT